VEFSKYAGHDLYHLEHYSNLVEYKDRNGTATPRKKNPVITKNLHYKVNFKNWGLKSYNFDLVGISHKPKVHSQISTILMFPFLLMGLLLLLFDISGNVLDVSFKRYINRLRILVGKIRRKLSI
jgi:hypothetical protein